MYSRHRLGKSSQILVDCWATKDTIMQCLRLKSNMEWFSHPLLAYKGAWQPAYAVDGHMVPYSACYHHLSCPRFGNPSKILVFTAATGLQMTTLCSGWGSNPNWNGSHIPGHHMKGACKLSHGIEGHMEPSSGHFNYVYAKIWEVFWNPGSWCTARLQKMTSLVPLCSGEALI